MSESLATPTGHSYFKKIVAMNARILVVEDNPQVAESLYYLLVKEGYEVTTCFDGLSALNFMERENYDLVVTDLLIPFVSGLNLIKHIRLHKPFLPVIVISSVLENKIIDHIQLLGVRDYMQKPLNAQALCSDIKKRLLAA